MAARTFVVQTSPRVELSSRNCGIVKSKPEDWDYVKITRRSKEYYLCIIECSGVAETELKDDELGLNASQREWMEVKPDDKVKITPFSIPLDSDYRIGSIYLELDYFGGKKPKKVQPEINTGEMASYFIKQFNNNVFCNGQQVFIAMSKPYLKAVVLNMQVTESSTRMKSTPHGYGLIHPNTTFLFEKKPGSGIKLSGKNKTDSANRPLISPNWDFNEMGIGGLDKEFSDIFRRAFASRVFPADIIEKLGMKHVRGILLYGPPGTGKTLIARTIGNMLQAKKPKIVNGPEIFDKHVGESEKKMRELFSDAEKDNQELKNASPLHIIIFDEMDAVCRARGSLAGSTGVQDTVVNQLLSKLDGVEQLNNILVIGMTNRKDMIDEALLRPGRLEVQMEISLPDEPGRLQILTIHTKSLRLHNMLADDVTLEQLAKETKNFSGAELAGLVRSATTTAMNKLIKVGVNKELEVDGEIMAELAGSLKVKGEDFDHALRYDLKPAFGTSEDRLSRFMINSIIPWCSKVQCILDCGTEAVKTVLNSQSESLMSMLLHGPPDTGKTALAAEIATNSDIMFIKVISPEDMVGFSESAKCNAMNKIFEDAYKSKSSCIIIDNIERILEYVAVGPTFSNLVYQTLLVLLKKMPPKTEHRILIIGTTGMDKEVLEKFGLKKTFHITKKVPCIKEGTDIMTVVEKSGKFTSLKADLVKLKSKLENARCEVGIKKLLKILESSVQNSDGVDDLINDLIKRLKKDACLQVV